MATCVWELSFSITAQVAGPLRELTDITKPFTIILFPSTPQNPAQNGNYNFLFSAKIYLLYKLFEYLKLFKIYFKMICEPSDSDDEPLDINIKHAKVFPLRSIIFKSFHPLKFSLFIAKSHNRKKFIAEKMNKKSLISNFKLKRHLPFLESRIG